MKQEPEFWRLVPENFTYPLNSSEQTPFLHHYERIRTRKEWEAAGFEIDRDRLLGLSQCEKQRPFRFSRHWSPGPAEQEAISTGKRYITHFYQMLDYVRVGVPFDDFISHPQHFQDFCVASLALDDERIADAIDGFRKALTGDPSEVRYAERFFFLRVEVGEVVAPAEELVYFTNEVDSMIHTERVYAWVKLLLSHKDYTGAANILRRVAQLLEDKIAGRLPKGRYSGDSASFVAYKRDQFRKKLESWASMRKYQPLMAEVEHQGGLPAMMPIP